jgi:lipopolysaccharide export system permease protein
MIAELHGRLARALSVPFLPMLGIPLALGRRRSDRSYGIAAGLLVLILYNQVLDLGENMVETGDIGPWLGLWLPFGAFAIGTAWLFHRASSRLAVSGGMTLPAFALLPAPLARAVEIGLARIGRRL